MENHIVIVMPPYVWAVWLVLLIWMLVVQTARLYLLFAPSRFLPARLREPAQPFPKGASDGD